MCAASVQNNGGLLSGLKNLGLPKGSKIEIETDDSGNIQKFSLNGDTEKVKKPLSLSQSLFASDLQNLALGGSGLSFGGGTGLSSLLGGSGLFGGSSSTKTLLKVVLALLKAILGKQNSPFDNYLSSINGGPSASGIGSSSDLTSALESLTQGL